MRTRPWTTVRDSVRLAFSLLTVAPVRATRIDRETAGPAMLLAPLVGATVGLAAALVVLLATVAGVPALVAGVAGVGTLALVTRGLHLDGLADTADGLGCYGDAERALAVMKAPDVGPFGVVTLLLVVVAEVACFGCLDGTGSALPFLIAPVVAAATGRLAITWACRREVPAARPGGLGALVAGTVSLRAATGVTVLVVVLAAAGTGLAGRGILRGPLAVAAGTGLACALVAHCVRRFGGVTGDVLGAASEVATLAALVVLVAQPDYSAF
jgi:adenosylcobinamide-GDP ribazoletransferase